LQVDVVAVMLLDDEVRGLR